MSAVDNHRWYSPVTGTVVYTNTIKAKTSGRLGLFLEEGYCEANTRAVIIIETEDGHFFGIVPIGLTPINTVTVKTLKGKKVLKGEHLGQFEIGGSAALILMDKRLSLDFEENTEQVDSVEGLLNLNYVGEKNKSRFLIGQKIAELTN